MVVVAMAVEEATMMDTEEDTVDMVEIDVVVTADTAIEEVDTVAMVIEEVATVDMVVVEATTMGMEEEVVVDSQVEAAEEAVMVITEEAAMAAVSHVMDTEEDLIVVDLAVVDLVVVAVSKIGNIEGVAILMNVSLEGKKEKDTADPHRDLQSEGTDLDHQACKEEFCQ